MPLSESILVSHNELSKLTNYSVPGIWTFDVVHQPCGRRYFFTIRPLRIRLEIDLVLNLRQEFATVMNGSAVIVTSSVNMAD